MQIAELRFCALPVGVEAGVNGGALGGGQQLRLIENDALTPIGR